MSCTMKTVKVGTITKLDIMKAPKGHQHCWIGTGIHRNWKKQPKGGKSAANRKAIEE